MWAEHCGTKVKGFVESQPGNAGVMFFLDEQNNQGLTLTLWVSEEDAAATDKFADQSRQSTVDATGVELVSRGAYRVAAGSDALLPTL